jgi:hypothetical protein
MVTNRLGNKNFMQPNENAQGSLAFIFRFWRGEEGGGLFVFFFCSHQVPHMFPKFPMYSLRHSQQHLFSYPILFGHNFDVFELERRAKGKHDKSCLYILGSALCSKIVMMGQSHDSS